MTFELWYVWQKRQGNIPALFDFAFSQEEAQSICDSLTVQKEQFGAPDGTEFMPKFQGKYNRLSELIAHVEETVQYDAEHEGCHWKFVAYCAEKATRINTVDIGKLYERRANDIRESGTTAEIVRGERLCDIIAARDSVIALHEDVSNKP